MFFGILVMRELYLGSKILVFFISIRNGKDLVFGQISEQLKKLVFAIKIDPLDQIK